MGSIRPRALEVLTVALLTVSAAASAALENTSDVIPRLNATRQLVLPAGQGQHAVGIVVDLDEGGWEGPSSAAIDKHSRVLIADGANGRVLVLGGNGQTTDVITMPSGLEVRLVGFARDDEWMAAVGMDEDGSSWLVRLPLGWRVQHSADSPARIALRGYIRGMASDRGGATYLVSDVGSVCLWRVAWNGSTPEQIEIRGLGLDGLKCWAVVRAADGHVYALVRGSGSLQLVRFDLQGRPEKQWSLTRLLDVLASSELMGIDKSMRMFLAEDITADEPWDPPDRWGYLLRCYAITDESATMVAAAEIRYGTGDMEGYPGCVALGDGRPLSLAPDGAVVLRAANSKQFKLKFYAPPPWRGNAPTVCSEAEVHLPGGS